MEALGTQLTSVGSTRAGLIAEEMLTPLGLQESSRITLAMSDGQIILRPVDSLQEGRLLLSETLAGQREVSSSNQQRVTGLHQEPSQEEFRFERKRLSPTEAKTLLDELSSMYAGQPSLEEEYFRDRDTERW